MKRGVKLEQHLKVDLKQEKVTEEGKGGEASAIIRALVCPRGGKGGETAKIGKKVKR